METAVIKVTPALATEWLSANDRNRNLNAKIVESYARDMIAGAWALNGEAVKIAENGTLLDGQHRLAAIVRAGIPVETVVITGLPLSTQATMDSGRKRTLADNLRIEEVHNSSVVASIALRMHMWDAGNRDLVVSAAGPTQLEQRAWISANPVVHRAAEMAVRVRREFKLIAPSIVGSGYVLFNRVDAGDTAEFFASLGSGAGLDKGHPILLLRNRAIRDASESRLLTDRTRLGLMIKAWNGVRTNEWPQTLQMTKENKMPKPE